MLRTPNLVRDRASENCLFHGSDFSRGRFQVNSPHVAHETIDGETIAIDLETGNYYSLENVASDIWLAVAAQLSFSQIVDELETRYDGNRKEIEEKTIQFVKQLQQENLIVVTYKSKADGDLSLLSPILPSKSAFESPRLNKYDDMQDLLLLDPIHEVQEERGWPNLKTES